VRASPRIYSLRSPTCPPARLTFPPTQHGITLSDLSPSRLLAAIEILAPKAKAAPRKQGFKVAAALPEAEARNADAGWQGNCGLVDIVRGCESNHGDSLSWLDASLLRSTIAQISPDELVMVLKLTDLHTRAVWTELVCKSFRCARHSPRATG
jgi:hypothetical protein